MPIQNQSTVVDAVNQTFHDMFAEVFSRGAPGVWSVYTDKIATNSKLNEIDVLEAMPVVRKWVGAKVFQSILASKLSVSVETYEKSFAISRLDLMADKMGMVTKRLGDFLRGDGSGEIDKICSDALISNSGNGPTCYDGQALFSTTHPRSNGTTWSNKTTSALSFAQFDAIMVAGMSLRDDNGEPMRISYDTLVVGPKNQKIAMEITQSTERVIGVDNAGIETGTRIAATSIPNVYGGGQTTLIVDPRLVGTADDYYYLLDTTRGAKPIVYFSFRDPEAITMDQMNDTNRFLNDQFLYSVELDGVAAAGSPHVAYAGIL